MGAIGRTKLEAERAAAAALADRVAFRRARERAIDVARAKAATPEFLFTAFAAGLVAGTFAQRPRRESRADDMARASRRADGPQKLASTAAGLLRIVDYYLRRS